jgi:spore germination protein KC
MIGKYNKLICVLLLPIFLTGCWDYQDINERTISITVGVDVLDDDIEFVGEKVKPSSGSAGEGSTNSKVTETYKFKASGRNIDDMRREYETKIPRPDFTQSAVAFVISKKYAEKKGIESYINRGYFTAGLRSSMHVAVSKESVDELLSKKVENAISVGYGIETTMDYLERDGKAFMKSVQDIQSDINFGNIGYLLPYITIDDNTIKYLGFAVMVDSRLVDTVNIEDSDGFLFLLSKKANDTRAFGIPNNNEDLISINTRLKKRRIKTSYEDNKINIYIDLKLQSQVRFQYHIKPLSDEDIQKIEEKIETEMKKNILAALKRSQNEFKSDVLGFARYFKSENPKIYKTINWKQKYSEAVFHVNVNTTIANTGLLDPNVKKPE